MATTDTHMFTSYIDIHLDIDSEDLLRTKSCDKRVDFNFPIANIPFYVATFQQYLYMELIYISELIGYVIASGSHAIMLLFWK